MLTGVTDAGQMTAEEQVEDRDARVHVFCDEGRLVAEMQIEPPQGNGRPAAAGDVSAALAKEGVVFGVDNAALATLLAPGYDGGRIVVARGIPAQDGVDGECTEHFSRTVEKQVKAREDGSVDYKELGLINEVREGTVICSCTPPVAGVDGTNVQGKTIKAREGKKAIPPVGENVRTNPDGLRSEAAVAGNLVFRDGRFTVETVYRVQDVDYDVGNITFLGDVQVNGDMQDGFEIHAGGTVTLRGQVGAVVIEADHIIIEKGINGTGKAELTARKTLKAGFVENCNLYIGEKMSASSLINCQVECEGDVEVTGGKGIVCGGKITVFNTMQAKVVGNESHTMTVIVLGVTARLMRERSRMSEQLADVSRHLEEMNKNIAYIQTLVEAGKPIPPDRVQLLQRSKIQMPMTEKKKEQLEKNLAELDERLSGANAASLTAKVIYPPTKVSIGNLSSNVNEKRSMCRVYKSSAGELVFGSA